MEGQLLLLQELDFLQFLLELPVLELLLLMHALGRETHILGPAERQGAAPCAREAGALYVTPQGGGDGGKAQEAGSVPRLAVFLPVRLPRTAHSSHWRLTATRQGQQRWTHLNKWKAPPK